MDFQALVNNIRYRGWSAQRIADEIGISRAYVYRISRGEIGEPTWSIGQKLIGLEVRTRP